MPFQNSPVIGTEQLLSLVSHNSRSGRSKSFPVLRDVKVGKQRPWGGGGETVYTEEPASFKGLFHNHVAAFSSHVPELLCHR